jgi:hypothetical protein
LTSPRRWLSAALSVPFATALFSVVATAPASSATPAGESAPGAPVVLLAGTDAAESFVPPVAASGTGGEGDLRADVGTEGATIVVNYTGFSFTAQVAFQKAVDYWEELIISPVTIEIDAEFVPLGSNVLGSAGPETIHRNECAAMTTATWYPSAVANALCTTDLNGSVSEGSASFNSSFSQGGGWYFGLDGNPAGNQWDFVTVVMHELGHALGFLGSMNVTGNNGRWGFSSFPPVNPMIFDIYAENAADGTGNVLWSDPGFPNPGPALKTQLTSQSVYFAGPATMTANGGNAARLYAPPTWQGGSSFSHLDEDEYPIGNGNSLMTPILSDGEAIHSPGALVLAMFEDMGWVLPVAPDAPINPVATAGSNAAKVTFDPPASDGGSAITQYTVTASPGGGASTGASSPVYVAGLTNGTAYTFTVEATNAFGTSPPSAASLDATPALHGFHPLEPERILDTRFGNGPGCSTCQPIVGARTGNSTTEVQVTTLGDVPTDGTADAVVINVTATQPAKAGWLTIWPTGDPLPNTSNLNFSAGKTVPNLVTVKLGTGGKVNLGNTNNCVCAGSVHVIFDVVGYYANDGSGAQLEGEAPTRILDTRPSSALAPQEHREIQVAGFGPVDPAATAVVMNVTAVTPTKAGWLTIFPSDQLLPGVSNLNFTAGQVVPNLVKVKLGVDGKVKIGNTNGCTCAGFTHVILDVVGWYGPTATSGGLNAVTPARILDTRFGVPGANLRNTALAPQEQATIQVGGLGTVPQTGVSVVVLNVTAVTPTASGWLTLWPLGSVPTASNLNFVAGQTVPNLVVVALAPDGTVQLGNGIGNSAAGFTHVIFDVVGWYASP